ncbi:hypothetical protein FWG76_02310 [Candidatus Saccharibacteria bacterium]|nr:hypothetical protein [Candidatus Saccharibacteria bacterium]
MGNLVSRPAFFGSATSETISANNNNSSWNGNATSTVIPTGPWFVLGGRANEVSGTASGVFATGYLSGADFTAIHPGGHRTILLGY